MTDSLDRGPEYAPPSFHQRAASGRATTPSVSCVMTIAERWKDHPAVPKDLEARFPRVVERLRRGGAEAVYLFGSTGTEPGS